MHLNPFRLSRSRARIPGRCGSVLIAALLISTGLAVGLVSYLSLSRTALKLAHRTLFTNDATNLAEAGLEEALYGFGLLSSGVAATTAWTGWTLSGTTARRTLPQFNRDQNAVGTVKIYVSDYTGIAANSSVISQATITPFDGGPPITKVLRLGVLRNSAFVNGIVGLAGLTLKGQPIIDSFNSNPTNSPTGPWRLYTAAIAESKSIVVVKTGTIDLGSGSVKGNVALGSGVAPPPAAQVSGSITTNYPGVFPMPAYPTAASVSRSYTLGANIPAQLPVNGHQPANDGRHYYFVTGATIGATTIASGKNVTIVGTTTKLGAGLKINGTGTVIIMIDGAINASTQNALTNANWAGALQIFTTTADNCAISGNGELRASLFAPNATLKASGGGASGSVVGSYVAKSVNMTGQMSFHYDEALRYISVPGGSRWSASSWGELVSGADLAALSALTGNFLP